MSSSSVALEIEKILRRWAVRAWHIVVGKSNSWRNNIIDTTPPHSSINNMRNPEHYRCEGNNNTQIMTSFMVGPCHCMAVTGWCSAGVGDSSLSSIDWVVAGLCWTSMSFGRVSAEEGVTAALLG